MKKLFLVVLMSTVFLYSQAGAKALASDRATAKTDATVAATDALSRSVEKIQFWDCAVNVNLKITFSDGTTVQVSGTVTIKDISCADLLKKLLAPK